MQKGEIPDPRAGSTKFRAPPLSAAGVRVGYKGAVGLYALCAEEGQFLRFEQNFGRFLRFTHIWMK